ncbi:MAG: hypothetical protein ACYDH8_13055 [Syntrophales bacterium]
MGRSMYNFGKQTKEKARQQKQLAKASKRMAAKQQKANLEAGVPIADSEIDEQPLGDDNVKDPA